MDKIALVGGAIPPRFEDEYPDAGNVLMDCCRLYRNTGGAAMIMDQPCPTVFRDGPKVGRNSLCPCGSGLKFKKCCIYKNEE